LIQLKELNGGW